MLTQLKQEKRRLTYAELWSEYEHDYIPYERLLQTEEWQEKRLNILARDNHTCTKCGISHNLQVHHTFYSVQKISLKKNKFIHNAPWEYPDEALITVCSRCHQIIHRTTKIPILEEIMPGKYAKKDFTPCYRCNGVGYFSCYKHIQQGICFRCNGQRFEELR